MMINQKQKTMKKTKSSLKDGLIISIGILISILILWFLIRRINLQIVWKTLQDVPLWIILSSLFAISLASFSRAKAWQVILNHRISYQRSFRSVNEGQLLNTFLPLRLGDIARAVFTLGATQLKTWELLASIAVERFFDIFIMVVLLLLALPFIIGSSWISQALWTSISLIIIGLVGFIALIFWSDILIKIWSFVFRKWEKTKKFGIDKIQEVSHSLQILRNFKTFSHITFWMLLTWTFASLSLLILLSGFIPNPTWIMIAFLQGVSGLGVSIPSSPGNIGVYEASLVLGLSAFKIDESIGFAFGVLHHLLSVLPVIILGLISIIQDRKNFKNWMMNLRTMREE